MKKGFTLIELLIVITLTIILFEVILLAYNQNNQSYNIMSAKSELYKNNLHIIDTIRSDIKKSNSLIDNYLTYSSGTHSIILKITRLDSNSNPIANTYDYVIYQLNTSDSKILERIHMVDEVATTRQIATNINAITFSPKDNLGNNITTNWENTTTIHMDIHIRDRVKNTYVISKLSSSETMRNK